MDAVDGTVAHWAHSADACGAGAAETPLGKNADFASGLHDILPPPATVRSWYLRSYGREILKKHGIQKRMRWCGSRIGRKSTGVSVYARPDRAYGRVGGVCVCGQSLACPVCAPRIAAFRGSEVAEAFGLCSRAGFEARLVTFTIPHTESDTLGGEIDRFAEAWRRFQSGRKALEHNAGSFGNHVAREVTWGVQNGWHYHFHQLRYDERGAFCADRFRADWLSALDSVGRRWKGAEEHAFDVGLVGDDSGARYVAKLATSVEAQARSIGLEVSGASMKGRNLNTLLQSACGGDASAESVWLHGVKAIISRKVSSVRWSRGLRGKLGLSAEKSDEQIALEEACDSDVLLGELTPMQWRGILNWRAEFALCCAANKGRDAVNEFLAGLDLGELDQSGAAAVFTPDSAEYRKEKYVSV